jgi:hypothetical protein
MSWQLWVVMALVAVGLVVLATARMRHARKVFDDITDLDRPVPSRAATDPFTTDDLSREELARDELARARARHHTPDPHPRRSHG